MPKGGSGFLSGAGRAASTIQRGASYYWRLSNPGDYTKEIVDAYRQLYRSGGDVTRNSRGEVKAWNPNMQQLRKLYDIAGKMAENVQEYNPTAAEAYSNLRKTWGKAVRVNAREMEEFRRGMQYGDRMLINPRGGRNASDAANRAREGGYNARSVENVGILLQANREMNSTRNDIWQSARKTGGSGAVESYRREIYDQLVNRYLKTERAAARRRRK